MLEKRQTYTQKRPGEREPIFLHDSINLFKILWHSLSLKLLSTFIFVGRFGFVSFFFFANISSCARTIEREREKEGDSHLDDDNSTNVRVLRSRKLSCWSFFMIVFFSPFFFNFLSLRRWCFFFHCCCIWRCRLFCSPSECSSHSVHTRSGRAERVRTRAREQLKNIYCCETSYNKFKWAWTRASRMHCALKQLPLESRRHTFNGHFYSGHFLLPRHLILYTFIIAKCIETAQT